MEQKQVVLTPAFNEAAVKKGDTFRIDLMGGGLVGATWDTEVVSGKATLLGTKHDSGGFVGGCMPVTEQRVFRAEEAGEIVILATERRLGSTQTFKVKVS